MFLEISQNSQGNTCARFPFFKVYKFIKKETLAQVFSCVFCEISKNTFYCRTPLGAAFGNRVLWRKTRERNLNEKCCSDWKLVPFLWISLHKKWSFPKDFFIKCDQIRSFLRIWSHLLKKSLMENFILCAVSLKIKTKNTRTTFICIILVPFRCIIRIQPNIYDGIFLQKQRLLSFN